MAAIGGKITETRHGRDVRIRVGPGVGLSFVAPVYFLSSHILLPLIDSVFQCPPILIFKNVFSSFQKT